MKQHIIDNGMGGGQIQISHNINNGIVTGNGDASGNYLNNSVSHSKSKKTKSSLNYPKSETANANKDNIQRV